MDKPCAMEFCRFLLLLGNDSDAVNLINRSYTVVKTLAKALECKEDGFSVINTYRYYRTMAETEERG